MFYKKNKMALVAILCVVAVCANLFACSKKDSAASSGSDSGTLSSGTASGGGSSQEQAVAKADKKASKKASAPKGVKFATKPTPEADFVVTLTEDGTGAVVTQYNGTDSAVYIPATIQGLPVKEVDFGYNLPEGVTSLVVSDGCELVKASNDAYSLKAVSLPDSVKEFYLGGTSLTEFEVPASVQKVGELPRTLEKVSFRGVPEVIDGFFFSKITSIVLPEGVKTIEVEAFYKCENLESLTLPSTIEFINSHAFSGCSNLKELIIPESLTSVEISSSAFPGCSSLPLATQARLKQLGYEGSFN